MMCTAVGGLAICERRAPIPSAPIPTTAPFPRSPTHEACMHSRFRHRNVSTTGIVFTAIAALAACSGGEKAADTPAVAAEAPCTTPADSIIGLAAKTFATQVKPVPHRFLVTVGTDSALPDRAYWGLQTTGATLNMLPKDPTQHQKAIQALAPGGSYVLLLTNYHGQRKLDDGRTAVDFSGHYLTGSAKGTAIPRTTVVFSCQATGAERFVIQPAATGA